MARCIYSITSKVNGKYYLGVAEDFEKRKYMHLWHLRNNKHTNSHLQSSYHKYGEDNFIFDIIILGDNIDTLYNIEGLVVDKEFIKSNRHYNQVLGGKGGDHGGRPHNVSYILDPQTGIYWDSIKEASEVYNVKHSTLRAQLNGQNPNKLGLIKT